MKHYTEWKGYISQYKGKYGIWEVKGEDPNCDFAGPHREPSLGLFEGFYEDVFEYATTLNAWCAWGAGGHVYSHSNEKIIKIKSKRERKLEKITEQTNVDILFEKISKLEHKDKVLLFNKLVNSFNLK